MVIFALQFGHSTMLSSLDTALIFTLKSLEQFEHLKSISLSPKIFPLSLKCGRMEKKGRRFYE